jgi:ribose transport system ATP-binding protein
VRRAWDAVREGIAYLSEDRRGCGLVMGMSIVANTTLVSLRRYARPLIRPRLERAAARRHIERLSIRIGRVNDLIDTLSGGNQQKVAIAKWLEITPRVLILDEPTRGVDIGAKEEIYRLIHDLAKQGMACIFISSELNELLGMCHRIAVMRAGRIVATLDGATATEEEIVHYAAGVKGAAA